MSYRRCLDHFILIDIRDSGKNNDGCGWSSSTAHFSFETLRKKDLSDTIWKSRIDGSGTYKNMFDHL